MANTKTISVAISLLILAGCSSGGGGGGGASGTATAFYKPLTEEDANQKYGESGHSTDMQLVHTDGLENSELDIADLNIVVMDRADNGDIFLSFDAVIYSFGSQYLDPDVWAGSNRFSLYIDNDNNRDTGYLINGIGADIKLHYLGQNFWNSSTNNWDSTWFESAPPLGGIRAIAGGGYEVHSDIKTGATYFRSFQRINYLDALVVSADAKGVLQIMYDITEPSGFNIIETSLDTTAAFEMPDI